MARYELTAPDGGRYEVTAPDSMPEAAVLARFKSEIGKQPAPQPELSWGEYGQGLARSAAQGATFNFGGELGLVDEKKADAFSRQHPIASTVASIAGGVPLLAFGPGAALARGAMGAGSMAGNVGRSAALGAGLGGLSGAGAGEGGLAERLPSAATGAAVGGVLGGAIPPVTAGVGRVASTLAPAMSRARPRTITEQPPVHPAGAPEVQGPSMGGPPVGGISFVDERTQGALNAQDGALRMVADWILSAGGTVDDIERAWAAVQQSGRFHSSGEALNAQTLAEIYPPLQRLLRAGASGYREVGEDATRFLQARQTGILPPGASAQSLAQRGIPTRERFLPGRTVQENLDAFGVQLGTGARNQSPTGQLGRLVDATKRLFRIKDFKFHGHATTASRTSDDIVAAMKADSDPAYTKAFAAGDLTPLRPTLQTVLQKWEQTAAQSATAIRRVLERGINQFRRGDKDFVNRLREFDSGKQALDDLIGDHLGKNSGRLLQQMKRELLDAVDNVPGSGPLYATARGIYAKGARDRDLLEDFRNAWKDDPDDVLKRYDALSDPEDQKLARLGIVWGMEAENAGRRGAQDATLGLDVRRVEQMLTGIGQRLRAGESDAADVMRRFGQYVGGEQEMVRGTAKTVVGGSMTDRNVQDALAMGGMEIVQNVQSFSNIWRGSQSLFEVGRALLEKIIDRSFGLSADKAREMSRMLLTANPQEITAIIARLKMMMPANRMARFNDLMAQAQRVAAPGISAGAGAAAPTPTTQPRGPEYI